ncbi:hypothetical protein CEUSTIGMA_g10583.t1 [Chlamydomonas eustigma]|uniref:RING-type domain-containing protein n=1 Tax=Chlamydomonas eustigma TaxID=1157962 RepID=A0A250XJA7_9CHLO|nr:hypothetical protein CEUSTIGMA_g10583.t1 [Chlamydomonas eustigma]|eukprot:GAX83157.1 hypothetical protein CEUSTIGMA_g10583.t1 [Chlamydomonas eustigma]
MSSETVFCFNCAQQRASHRNDIGDRVCTSCNSEFCELVEATRQPSPPGNVMISSLSFELPRGLAGAAPRPGNSGARVMIIHETVDLSNFSGAFQMGDYASQDSLQAIMSRLMQAYQPPRQPTSRTVVDSLPRLPVRPQDTCSKDDECCQHWASCAAGEPCTVCHETFEGGHQVLELPCKHCFHEDCILPWLKEHNTCPVCRHKLEVEEGSSEEREGNRTQNGAVRRYIRLAQQVDDLGQQLASLQTAAQVQVSQLLEGGNVEGAESGTVGSRTPLAELSDRLAATQRALQVAQSRLQSLESMIRGHQSLQSIAQRVVQANRHRHHQQQQQQQGHSDAVLDAQLLPGLARDLRGLRRQEGSMSNIRLGGTDSNADNARNQQSIAAEQDLLSARQELLTRLTAAESLHRDAMSVVDRHTTANPDMPTDAAATAVVDGAQLLNPARAQQGLVRNSESGLAVIAMEFAVGPLPMDLVVQPLQLDDLPHNGPAVTALAEVPLLPLPVQDRVDDSTLSSTNEVTGSNRDMSRDPFIDQSIPVQRNVEGSTIGTTLQLSDTVTNTVEGERVPSRTSSAGVGALALGLAGAAAAGALGSMQWLFRR